MAPLHWMTPARNNVRATRHFGIPARKSSPSAPLQPFPREKNSPGTPLQQFPREKVRPATASPWPNREKTLPARPKTPKSSHFSRAGRTFSRFQRRTTEQGEFSPATTPLNTHHRDTTTQPAQNPPSNAADNVLSPGHESARAKEFAQHPLQPFPREKTRPATAQSWPNREKTLPTRPKTPKSSQFSRAGRTFSRFPNQFTPQGELFRADSTLNV